MTVEIRKIYRLGEFELDPNKRLLKRDGRAVHLSNRPFRVLLHFVENRERIVTRQELLDQFWDGRDVYDVTLTKCVGAIRKALGDTTETPCFIETRWAEGYRYIGPLEEIQGRAGAATDVSEDKILVEQDPPLETPAGLNGINTRAHEPLAEALSANQKDPSVVRRPPRLAGWQFTAALAVALAVLVVGTWAVFFRKKPTNRIIGPDWSQAQSTKLTNQVGTEYSVDLAPDGKMFIYASRESGNWDLYWQRVGGRNTVNLTKDSTADDLQPAYSSDGNYIAFRSERQTPGIYIMEATSENVRRVSEVGFHPAWSPDGKELVVCTDNVTDPVNRRVTPSQLWVLDVATGAKRLLTNGDAVQPSWSPGGKRIAYWALQEGGQRDLWSIPASGGEAVRLTNDEALDWNPVWSPDGKYVYFASDRGGSMNFWRVAVDETSGKTQGTPETVLTPSVYSQHLSFSGDGKRLAYVQKSETRNLHRTAFDPAREVTAGQPDPVTEGTKYVSSPDLSPDEEWFAFSSQGERQEDILLIKRDGTEQRQLTNDVFRDRAPRWSPDGQRIAFYSDRSGRFEVWMINSDSTGLRQLTYTSGPSTVYPIWSPDGNQMLFKQRDSQPFLFEINQSWSDQTPQKLPGMEGVPEAFWATSWSPDGRKLVGSWVLNRTNYLHVYDFGTKTFENLNVTGVWPIWLSDNRRLFFERDGRLHLIDTQSKKSHEILSAAPYTISTICPTRDARTIYYTVQKTESDLWLLTRE